MRSYTKNPNGFDEDEDSDSSMEFHFQAQTVAGNIDSDSTEPILEDDNENNDNDDDDDDDDSSFESWSDNSENSEIYNREQDGHSAGTSSSTQQLIDEDDDYEEDETVRAIKSAILKPRSTPPEIKLDDFVSDLSFHPCNNIIALATMTGDILLYKYTNEENSLVKKLEVHTKACRSIEFNEDGRDIISASKDKSIMITDTETEKLKQFYDNAHNNSISKLYVIDENLFCTGDDSGSVKLWDKRNQQSIFSLKEVEDYITAMLTNDAKKLLLITSGDGYLTTLNIAARKMYVQSEPYEEELTGMGLFRNNSKVVVSTNKGRLYTYNWGQFGYHSDMFPGVKNPIQHMLPLTDRICCVGCEEGVLRAAHIAPFKNLGVVGQHKLPVESMDIDHSGEYIASSSHNNDVLFWNIKYFEDFSDIKYNTRHSVNKDRAHNLPSSKFSNTNDFFADLAGDD